MSSPSCVSAYPIHKGARCLRSVCIKMLAPKKVWFPMRTCNFPHVCSAMVADVGIEMFLNASCNHLDLKTCNDVMPCCGIINTLANFHGTHNLLNGIKKRIENPSMLGQHVHALPRPTLSDAPDNGCSQMICLQALPL